MSKDGKKITAKSIKKLVKQYNKECKADAKNEKTKEKYRALLAIRRILNGEDVNVTEEQLMEIGTTIKEATILIADKLESLNLEDRALQQLTLSEDVDEIVLEIIAIEEGGDDVS